MRWDNLVENASTTGQTGPTGDIAPFGTDTVTTRTFDTPKVRGGLCGEGPTAVTRAGPSPIRTPTGRGVRSPVCQSRTSQAAVARIMATSDAISSQTPTQQPASVL